MKKTPDTLRSARWFAPDDFRSFGHRSRVMQMGYGPADYVGKPVIAIVNTWSDANQCHAHFKSRVEDVKRGVLQAGGFPLELPAISLSESMVKPTTMLYRNFLAMETEELLRSHPVDGAVLMGGCDKTTPGLTMGALSMGLPFIYLPAGPMLRGNWRGHVLGSGSDAFKYWDERRAGRLSDGAWHEMEAGIARSHGTCMTMGTAATMMGIAEAVGFTLPGASSIPAADASHVRMSAECGRRIVQMVWDDLTPAKMLRRANFENGIAVAMAEGCSTNAIIHLVAMSRRAGHPVTLDDFDAASRKVPVVANIRPSGDRYLMEDFYYAGGLRALMGRITPHLKLDALTVNGRTLGENIAGAEVFDDDVIRPLDNPIYAEGALAVLRGNLAPDGVVIKPSACEPRLLKHTGRALVFDDYPALKNGGRRPESRRHRRRHPGAALRRPAGRPRHARVGHAADPDQAAEAGRERHAAPERRADERHQLRRLPAALRARSLCRRAACAGEDRRSHHGGRAGAAHPPRGERCRTRAPQGGVDTAAAALRARLRLDVQPPHPAGRPGLRLRLPRNRVRRPGVRAGDLLNEPMNPKTKDQLMRVSTATLCTGLFKRGLRNQFIQDVRPLNPNLPNMVGEAFTLRYIPAREDLNPITVFQDRAHPQRKAVEECPPGAVFVIDSRKDARAASAGAILVTRLMKRGVAGVVTDGGFRDSPEIARLAIPAYHHRPSAPTNLTLHQALDINVPIGCGDVPVWPGDVVVGDGEGVIVIPAAIADEIAAEAVEMTAFEDFVTEKVNEGRSILGLYPPTDAKSRDEFAAWRKAKGR